MRCSLFVLAFVVSGCVYEEATAPRAPDPAGVVNVQVNGGAVQMTTAVVHMLAVPPVLEGASADVTVSITLGEDASGLDPKGQLGNPRGAIQLLLSPTSRNHLEVHTGGDGCLADAGMVSLDADTTGLIEGSFQATGLLSSGGGACAIQGSLAKVPADQVGE